MRNEVTPKSSGERAPELAGDGSGLGEGEGEAEALGDGCGDAEGRGGRGQEVGHWDQVVLFTNRRGGEFL